MWSCPARHCERNFDARLFHFYLFSEKIGFQTSGRFMISGRFSKQFCFPEMPQKCLGGVWDHPRPIRDQFWTILDQHRLTNYIRTNPITNHLREFVLTTVILAPGACRTQGMTCFG